MYSRRRFAQLSLGSLLGGGLIIHPLLAAVQSARAAARKVVAKGTAREALIHEDPAALDTSQLELTPLDGFGTMGPTDRVVDRSTWRLEVTGEVKKPVGISYAQLLALPHIQRDVLLICPGFFANHGRWTGVSLRTLLEQADFDRTATRVAIRSNGQKDSRFPMADALSDKVFLAYLVNGQELPRRHGFPLRVVAEGYYGSDWVKYVDRIIVENS